MSSEGRDVKHTKVTNKVGTGVSTNTNNDVVMDVTRSDVVNYDVRVIAENIHDESTKGDNGMENDDVTGLKSREDIGPHVLKTTHSTCPDFVKESMAGLISTTGILNVLSMRPISYINLVSAVPKSRSEHVGNEPALNVENPVIEEVITGDKAITSGTQEEGKSSTRLVERINVFEKEMLEGKPVLVDDYGKPLEKVDYSGNTGSEDEVEHVDIETASYVASKLMGVGYDTKSLLKQSRKTVVDDDYGSYDDDMYKGQEIPENIHTICDILDIKHCEDKEVKHNDRNGKNKWVAVVLVGGGVLGNSKVIFVISQAFGLTNGRIVR
ncbi:hypothetical protein Tco_0256551 [Tanacetum coccineum]